MKKKKLQCSVPTLLLAGVLCLTLAACGAKQSSDMPASDTNSTASAALPVKAMNAKRVDENPYMAKSDANIHHDGYNTDSTDEVLPLGIYPEINVSYEKTNANASPAIYFDSYGHAVVPLLGGIAIRDLNAEETTTLGYFSPKQHDGGGYVIQSSYTFLDSENRIVCPTSNNHVLMLRATDEAGNVLPEFEKVLDIDIKAAAEAALGKELTQNLLSVVFDYDGNLWFATGGFRIYPEREQQGVLGYIAHSAIEAILNGEQADLSKAVFVHELTPGEGAENGIAASKDGAVILTNKNCYLLRAEDGVDVAWCTPYESVGAKVSGENDKTTGGGLAWGGGCSPSLTPDLVMFTDNADPVKLLALDMKTGEIVASMPVLDDLPEGYQVAVENSAIVYDDSEGTVSTIVCNWFGAGSAGLADPNSDSSIQSYANIYDMNWLTKGNCMIAPGVERVDTVKTDSGYEMKSIWSRNDLSDTSILKLSTATGYIYGYVQDLESGMWQYIILDFATGETVFTMDVSNKYGYNNMAIGMYAGNSGNALYDKVLGASNLPMLRYEWVWYKSRCTGFLNARRAPLKRTENILVFYQKLPYYDPQFEQGKPYKKTADRGGNSPNYGKFVRSGGGSEDGLRFPGNLLTFPSVQRTVHPTQKPVELCEYFIKTYTRPGEVVADICAGSGTTAVAAVNTGRRFICFETAPAFYAPATERIRLAQAAAEAGEKGV